MPRSASRPRRGSAAAQRAEEVDAVMAAARALVGVLARSLAEAEATVTVSQLRILVLVATREQVNLGSVASELGVHPSNASRACDRLVEAGLLERRDSTTDRRNLVLELSPEGEELVESVIEHRRTAMETILSRMSAQDRTELAPALRAFAAAAGELHDDAGGDLIWVPAIRHDRDGNT